MDVRLKDNCPICSQKLSEFGSIHINYGTQPHVKSKTAKCFNCEIKLSLKNGEWRTTWVELDDLKVEVNELKAKSWFVLGQMGKQENADNYDMSLEEYDDMKREDWKEFISKKRENDVLYGWKRDNEGGYQNGLAILRGKHIVHVCIFDRPEI
jgi:hypothetical protein